MKRRATTPVLLLVFLLLLFVLLTAPGLLAAPLTLLVGWWSSAARFVARWQFPPAGVVLFFVALMVLAAGAHQFLAWLYSALKPVQAGVPPRWRWKWTFCAFGVLACTLFAICSLILTTHQIYWISKSSDPVFVDPFRERLGLLLLAMELQKQGDESAWNLAKMREFFYRDNTGSGQSAAEAVQAVWLEGDEGSLRAVILIPRHPLNRGKASLSVLRPGTNSAAHPLEELPRVLASLNVGGSDDFPPKAAARE